jgi:hypothetical protein
MAGANLGGQPMSKQVVANTAAEQAGTMASNKLAAAQSTVQQQGQLGQQGLANKQAMDAQKLNERKLGLQTKQRQLSNQLNFLGEDAKQKIFDSNLSFQKDALGRTQFNERQLLDWKITQAKDVQDLQAYEQKVRQLSARKQQYLKASHAKVVAELENVSNSKILSADMQSRERLMRAKNQLETDIADERNRAANRAGMMGAAGTIVGTGLGALAGPQGAAAGGAIGGSIGTAASTIKL